MEPFVNVIVLVGIAYPGLSGLVTPVVGLRFPRNGTITDDNEGTGGLLAGVIFAYPFGPLRLTDSKV